MSSAAFYQKLKKHMTDQNPVGSVVPMLTGSQSPNFIKSGSVVDLSVNTTLSYLNQAAYKSLETTVFPLTGQVPLTKIACSPDKILTVGINSKIYLTDDGVTWTTINCPTSTGVFTNIYVEYIPSPINKFLITDRTGAGGVGGNETVYLSSDGITWSTYQGVAATAIANYIGSCNYTTYNLVTNKWERACICWNWYNIGDGNGGDYIVYNYATRVTSKSALTDSTVTYTDWQFGYYYYAHFNQNSHPMSRSNYIPISLWGSYTDNAQTYPYFCVNGLQQDKIFYRDGTMHCTFPGVNITLTAYDNGFKFPNLTNMIMVYDPTNNKYMAVNKLTNQFYTSSNGTTWSTASSIGSGIYSVNDIGIRPSQTRIIVIGDTIRTTDNLGSNWTTQSFLTLGGNFTSITTNNVGISIACALNSSVVAIGTTGTNFDLITITDSGNWHNIHFATSKFILTSQTKQLKTSTDGVNWTTQSNHTSFSNISHYITSMCNINNQICAISSSSTDTLTSTDGISWTVRLSTVVAGLKSICGCVLRDSTSRMVAVGNNICYTSDDYGTSSFTSRTIGTGNWGNLCYNGTYMACISLNTTKLAYSEDGITWNIIDLNFQPYSLCTFNNNFVIKGNGIQVIVTEDLQTFGFEQPCESPTSGAITVYDATNKVLITANSTSLAYSEVSDTKIRLPYIESTTPGMENYIKVK